MGATVVGFALPIIAALPHNFSSLARAYAHVSDIKRECQTYPILWPNVVLNNQHVRWVLSLRCVKPGVAFGREVMESSLV